MSQQRYALLPIGPFSGGPAAFYASFDTLPPTRGRTGSIAIAALPLLTICKDFAIFVSYENCQILYCNSIVRRYRFLRMGWRLR